MKGTDGKFDFKIKWPELAISPKWNYNIWKQSSNPMTKTEGGVDNYEHVDIKFN